MRYISVFSGIEAASCAFEPLGMEPVAFAEVDKHASAVLAAHYPGVPNLGDVSKVDWKEYRGKADLVVGGSPCQSFSIAGKREGLKGESGLMYEFIRCVREVRPRWFLWENVPGALSSEHGAAFGQLLHEMADGGGYGCAWRVLDAQFFGVAQRRRRVFLVGHLGDGGGAAAVLFESESVSGNTQTSRGKREELARAAGRGASARGGEGMNIQPSVLRAQTIDYKQTPKISDEISHTLTHEGRGGIHSAVAFKYSAGAAARTMLTYEDGSTPTLTADYHAPAVALQTGHTSGNGNGVNTEDVSYTLSQAQDQAICIQGSMIGRSEKNGPRGDGLNDNLSFTLNCTDRHAVAFAQNTRDEVRIVGGDGQTVGALAASPGMKQQSYVAQRMAATIHDGSKWVVRRLTPVECERLQGFPDGWTDIPYRGKEHPPDTPRYKAIGNSMAVPVMRWLGERIQMVQDIMDEMEQ